MKRQECHALPSGAEVAPRGRQDPPFGEDRYDSSLLKGSKCRPGCCEILTVSSNRDAAEQHADRPERPVFKVFSGDHEPENSPAACLEQHVIDRAGVIGDQERGASLRQEAPILQLEPMPESAIESIEPIERTKQTGNLRSHRGRGHEDPGPRQNGRR